ncbi:hypothetical protein FEM48_Zijuj03G0032500 [Ziziphus jujuba var. spinosa]|uniref:Uncharacterized protein n=1 Tax=Ziziphus jujuba var. spinosa TaxID=714518 RepID=A0A978VMV0_ZIZJJ|nr:hypothetical protein FEM48_Zijuj03G0032500 [Ziziphus jujuba var. spinosa]
MEEMVAAEDAVDDEVACIIHDGMLYLAQSVADHLKLLGISVCTSAAIIFIAFTRFDTWFDRARARVVGGVREKSKREVAL